MAKAKTSKRSKRLDGKKKLIAFTAEMREDLRVYCLKHGIESESECVRQAIVNLVDNNYDDNTLKLSGLKNIEENLNQIQDMVQVLFSYQRFMHINLLAYHPEIAGEFKDTALKSATIRHEKFFASFRERLRDEPSFFEKLLHNYVSGTLDE